MDFTVIDSTGSINCINVLNVDLPQTSKNIYYLILVLVFWTAYTAFNIPFYSFGAVITDVDSERVKLSAFREVLGYVGTFVQVLYLHLLWGKCWMQE